MENVNRSNFIVRKILVVFSKNKPYKRLPDKWIKVPNHRDVRGKEE